MTDTTDTDDEPELAERAAGSAAGAAAGTITTAASLIPVLREKFTRTLTLKSLKKYHDVTPGDAIGLIAEPGQNLDIQPIGYRPPKECDEGERPGWVERGGDKVWHAGSEGRVVDYIGDTPVVALERDGHVEAGWLKPRIGQAIELDRYDGLYRYPQIEADVVADLGAPSGDTTALADGGESMSVVDVSMQDLGEYQGAQILDLDSGDGYDGMRVDFRKASEWAFETTATEEMQMQQERGWLMGQLGSDSTDAARIFLYAALLVLGILAIVFLGPELINGSGGGGGINPLLTPLL